MSHHKPDPNVKVNLTIDRIPVTVPEGTRILEAAKQANINIPVLCEHPDLCKRALCRICVVECDGRGKLVAACANDVWEGVNIVTINQRLSLIRKTIVELILANHPQDCLSCVRNKTCELQALALKYCVGASSFENSVDKSAATIENDTLVRDMSKCIKCGRCVEACQEIQTIGALNTSHRSDEFTVSTAYKQSLKKSPCVFCGQCASVCPVGAIYAHDQTADVQAALNDNNEKKIALISPVLASAVNTELGFEPGTVTAGKLIKAVRLLGFDKVYDASTAADYINSNISREIDKRKENSYAKLPIISGCSDGVTRFITNFYPDLEFFLASGKNSRHEYASAVKREYAIEAGVNISDVTLVYFVPCIAQKYAARQEKTSLFLTAKELARMIKMAGIIVDTLPDDMSENQADNPCKNTFDNINIHIPQPLGAEKKVTVYGYAQARVVMEKIQKGGCNADWVEIFSCSGKNCMQ